MRQHLQNSFATLMLCSLLGCQTSLQSALDSLADGSLGQRGLVGVGAAKESAGTRR